MNKCTILMPVRDMAPARPLLRVLAAAATLLATLALPAQIPSSALAAHGGPAARTDVGPTSDWMDDMLMFLHLIANGLEDAWVAVGSHPGPLTDPTLSQVAMNLDDALGMIETVLDGVPEAGEIDGSFNPTTLPEYADDTRQLAKAAIESVSPVVDLEAMASKLKTIEHLITRSSPHNYRQKAGITTAEPPAVRLHRTASGRDR